MVKAGIYREICRFTKRAFGQPINPHLFRDCAVSTVATDDPEHIGIAAPLLGHRDPRTTEKHYVQANALAAGRRLRRSIDRLRLDLAPRSRRRQGEPA
jgi:integrase